MKNNEIKNINLLGQKRHKNYQNSIDETKADEEEKTKENNQKILTSKKPEFYITIIKEKNEINLEEGNGINIEEKIESQINNNININSEIILDKNICQRCNFWDNVLYFSCCKSVLDYLSKKKILLFKNDDLNENFNFESPKKICLNCLLSISKNRIEFEKFIESNKNEKNYVNDNPFNDLFENPNLKIFNDIDIKMKKTKNLNGENDKFKGVFKTSLNNTTNNNNLFNKSNIKFDFLNILNYFPLYFPISPINYNIPYKKNISNLNIQNSYNNDKNSKMKVNSIIRNNPLYHPRYNSSDILHNSLLNKSIGISTQNNKDKFNLCQLPVMDKNYPIDIKNKNENKLNTTMNINAKEKISKNINENLEQNNIFKNFTIIRNEVFDDIFHKTSYLLNKLTDVKIGRNLNLYNK